MHSEILISKDSKTPIYKQLMQSIYSLIDSNIYKPGDSLPSLNELAKELDISKETVKKAYLHLKEEGTIEPVQGKGFFFAKKDRKTKVLILFDKISTYKQVLFSSFAANIGSSVEMTIRLHNQDIALFEHFIDENLDDFDYYIIAPHFPLTPKVQSRLLLSLKRISSNKLIILDRHVDNLNGNFGCVYQDFENDVYDGLSQGLTEIKKFNKLNILSTKGSLYAQYIKKGIERFCKEYQIDYKIHTKLSSDIIAKQEIYLILNGQLDTELIELVKIAQTKNCEIGKDIGLISYNESPINEIILNGLTVLSTDFEMMGALSAKMIVEKDFKKIKCDFNLIKRNTF